MALIYYEKKEYQKAIELFLKSYQVEQNDHQTVNNLGLCYLAIKNFELSVKYFQEAIDLDPVDPISYNNKGNVLMEMSKFDEALQTFQRALSLDPSNHKSLLNLGNLKVIKSEYSEAIKCYELAIRLKNNYADAYFNLAMVKLLFSDFENGFRLYEWRLDQNRDFKIFDSDINKRWNGIDNLEGKTIIILAEQGLGDTIQFARFVDFFDTKKTKVVLKVQDCLKELISTMSKNITIIGNSEKIGKFDYQIPLLSIPYAFNLTYKTVPKYFQYLKAKEKPDKILGEKNGS